MPFDDSAKDFAHRVLSDMLKNDTQPPSVERAFFDAPPLDPAESYWLSRARRRAHALEPDPTTSLTEDEERDIADGVR